MAMHCSNAANSCLVEMEPNTGPMKPTKPKPARKRTNLCHDACVPFTALGPDTIERGEINLLYVAATRAKRQLQLNDELRRLMSYVPAEGRSPDVRPNNESDDMTTQRQVEEEFGS